MYMIIGGILILCIVVVLYMKNNSMKNKKVKDYGRMDVYDRVCPSCHEMVKKEDIRCPYCDRELNK